MHRFLLALSVALISIFSVTCSSDGPAGPEPPPANETSRSISPTGGSLRLENEDGVSIEVSLPAGAVLTPTRVTLRAVDAPAGVRARFAIEPAGLDLLAPATFTVTLPDGARIAETFGLSFASGERIPVPTEVDAGAGTLTATLFHLGFALPAPVAAGAPPVATAGSTSPDEFIDVEDFECQLLRDSLSEAILRAQAFVGPFPPDLASPLIQQYRAALLACGADSLSGQQAAMEALACAQADGAVLNSQVVLVESAQDLKQSLGALLAAEGVVQATGADCSIESSALESEFDEFLQAYIARINSPGFVASFPNWDALWRELITCLDIAAMSQEFAVPEAEATIFQELFPALFGRLREVAREACDEDENNSFLRDILTGGHALGHPIAPIPEMPPFTGFPQPEVVDEMHRCGSSVFVEAKTTQNELLDSDTIGLASESGSIRVIENGRIVLTSDILGFTCGGIVQRPPIRVRAEVPNTLPVVQLGTLSGQMTINVATTLSSLPEIGNEPPRNFDLVIERDRSVCGIDAAGAIELCRVQVNTTGFEGSMQGTWTGGCSSGPVSGTFAIHIARDGTVIGSYDGSAAGTIDGAVTSNGTLDASANGSAGPCTWSGSMSITGGILSGSGSWSCDAGCSGNYTSGTPVSLQRMGSSAR
jgi:hypothetical protein